MRRIYQIPFGVNFIEELAGLIFKQGQKDYSRFCVVFSGRRPFLYLQKALLRKINSPYYPPKMFTVDELVRSIVSRKYPGLRDIQYLDAVWMIHSLWKNESDFSEFFPWGKKILDFINMIDTEDVDSSALVNLQNNAEIGLDIPESVRELLRNIVDLREKFHARLEKEGYATRGYNYFLASRIIENELPGEFEKIYFCGLFGLTGAEKKIIKKLHTEGRAEIIWQGEKSEWGILAELASYFSCEVERLLEKPYSPPEIKIHSTYDTHSEVLKAYEILKKKAIENCCVVLPSSDALFPFLSIAVDMLSNPNSEDPTDVSPTATSSGHPWGFNITLRYPVGKTGLLSFIRQVIDCQLNARTSGGRASYYVKDYLRIISNPFFKNLEDVREAARNVEEKIKDQFEGKPFIELGEIKSIGLDEKDLAALKDIHNIFFSKPAEISRLSDGIEAIETILDFILEKSRIRSYVLSGEIFNLLFESLSELKKGILSEQVLSEDKEKNRLTVWNIILDLFDGLSLPFKTEPLQDLEIIGMLETRNLTFDNVIMLDVEENILPVEQKIDPLVPTGIYEQLGLPTGRDNEEMYRYYFYRLINGAKKVDLLYTQGEERQRSRYIEQILWDSELKAKKLNAMEIEKSVYRINLISLGNEERIEKEDAVMEKLKTIAYSPSSIDRFLRCRLLFYYQDILGLKVDEEISDDIDNMQRGSMVHEVLSETFIAGEELIPQDFDRVCSRMESVLREKFSRKSGFSGEYYIFEKIALFKLKNFIARHIKDGIRRKILAVEEKIKGSYKTEKGVINLKGRIDRVDYLPEHDLDLLVDYKTGNGKGKKIYPDKFDFELNSIDDVRENISSLQLPLYVLMWSSLKKVPLDKINGQLCFLGDLFENNLFPGDVQRERVMSNYYLRAIDLAMSDLLDPEKPFTKYNNQECSGRSFNCPFAVLCKSRG